MDFLVSNVWYLLALTVVLYGMAMAFQVRNMKRLMSFNQINLAPVVIFSLSGTVSGVLFLIGLIGTLIQYYKA